MSEIMIHSSKLTKIHPKSFLAINSSSKANKNLSKPL